MATRSPPSSSDEELSSSGERARSSKTSPRSEDNTVLKKSKRSGKSKTPPPTEPKHSSLEPSGSSSSVDSRVYLSTSSLPTVEEGEIVEKSRRCKSSNSGGKDELKTSAKSARSKTQPAEEKASSSSSKRSKGSRDLRDSKNSESSTRGEKNGDDKYESPHTSADVAVPRPSKRRVSQSTHSEHIFGVVDPKGLARPASASDVSAPGGNMPYTVVQASPSSNPLAASTSKVSKRKSQRPQNPKPPRNLSGGTHVEKSPSAGSKRTKVPIEGSQSASSVTSTSSAPGLTSHEAHRIARGGSSATSATSESSSSSALHLHLSGGNTMTHSNSQNSYSPGSMPSPIAASSSSMSYSSSSADVPQQHKQVMASLLHDVLRSPQHLALLHKHMKSEMCEENLDFWLEAQKFSFQLQFDTNASGLAPDQARVLEHSMPVYKTFIAHAAPRQLNLPSKVAARIRHSFTSPSPTHPVTASVFTEAQQSVFKVIECDPFPRFVKNVESNQLTASLVQLGVSLPNSDFEDLVSFMDENKSKWSKVSNDDGVKVHKMDSHGIWILRASVEIPRNLASVALYISQHSNWKEWLYPSETTVVELELLSSALHVIFLQWPSWNAPNKHRDTTLALGSRHEPNRSIIAFKSVPHSTAPRPNGSTPTPLMLSGWRITEADKDNNDACIVTFCIRADKSDVKKWDKDPSYYADSLLNLKKVLLKSTP